ncbi:MAG: hypothetical protein ACC651_13875 [Candidatus Scalindua sp.]
MMINKEQIKAEIDNIKDKHLVILYRIIKALEVPAEEQVKQFSKKSEWHEFIQETYGCLSDAPIERGDQGVYEVREEIG